MLVDEVSRRHLELVISSDGTRRGSLLSVLDETLTPVGARALQNWIVYPLLDLDAICARHDAVEELFETDLGGEVADALRRIGDLERLAGRIGSLRASPRDCLKLEQALRAVGALQCALQRCQSALIREIAARLVPMPELAARIDATIGDEPPVNPRDGNVIRSGFSPEVDELRALASDARGVIARLEAAERARSNIPSLKVRYNQVFGYYIEVTKPNLDRVPADYERKQTLVGAERFTTAALKELERKILGAESGLKELEVQALHHAGARPRDACRADPRDGGRGRRVRRAAGAGGGRAPARVRAAADELGPRALESATDAIRCSKPRCARASSCPTISRPIPTSASSCSSPGPTWPASRPTCARWR